MPAALTVSMATTPVGAAAGMSKTADCTVNMRASAVPFASLGTLTLAYGKSATRPTTFAGLTNPQTEVVGFSDFDTIQSALNGPTGNVSGVVNGVRADAAWTPGDHVWAALFDVTPPVAGSVPIATAGPFTVLA